MTPEQQAQYDLDMRRERIIKAQMSEEKVTDQRTFKLLLLGAGESGKSTLFKQMLTIYGQGVSKEELIALIGPIHANLQLGMTALCTNVERWGSVLPENEEACRHFQSLSSSLQDDLTLTPTQFQYLKQLWADPAIQTAWQNRAEFQIYDSTAYFCDKVAQIESPDYVPTEDDHLRIRVRTTGIVEKGFAIDGNQFRLFDVGGQRNERKKWIHCFENVTAVIFVAAISEYDQRLFEDETTNRLTEALKLFDDICNSRWFSKTALLLFLNKRDLFQEKIMQVPLSKYFSDYDGPEQDYQAAQTWILNQFKDKNRNPNKAIYSSVTTAIDTGNIRMVVNSVKDIIIRQALSSIGVA
jgi:GTPase SAR1 family protein